MTSLPLESWIKAQAYALGFDLAGIAELGPADTEGHLDAWLAAGYAGEMEYMGRNAHKRRDSRLPVPGAVSAIVVALNYGGAAPPGPIARYARGDDYHDVMLTRLRELHRQLAEHVGREVHGKPYVDTGPVLERELARRAGLGWFGKNTNLINPKIGSYFFIGSLFIDLALRPDAPFEEDRCGTCTRCLDECPTDAFTGPRVLDSRKCISYLTIELRGEIPADLRAPIGDHLYGCDVCQDVCPWNIRFAQELATDSPFKPRDFVSGRDARQIALDLIAMPQEEFSAAFRRSPMKRARLQGLRRNAAVVLANLGPTAPHGDTERPLPASRRS
ncbi:MAG TPA: tRNA epoxyqueuosine(34) reductase QueG [Gemmatimonadaceae bacterium]|nr:tRNA epoxyqueuosine(34) reductase QueG [Gemmatimonadaceae bacterium]